MLKRFFRWLFRISSREEQTVKSEVKPVSLPTKTTTILNGQSVSGALASGGGNLIGIISPTTTVGTGLAVQVSFDFGNTYVDLYDGAGNLFVVPIIHDALISGLDPAMSAAQYVKIRSVNNANAAVNETADRLFTFVYR